MKSSRSDLTESFGNVIMGTLAITEHDPARLCQLLADDFYRFILQYSHNQVHCIIGEGDRSFHGHGLFYDHGLIQCLSRGSFVGMDQSGYPKFSASEISDNHDQHIRQSGRKDLAVNRLSCRSGWFPVVVNPVLMVPVPDPVGVTVMVGIVKPLP